MFVFSFEDFGRVEAEGLLIAQGSQKDAGMGQRKGKGEVLTARAGQVARPAGGWRRPATVDHRHHHQ